MSRDGHKLAATKQRILAQVAAAADFAQPPRNALQQADAQQAPAAALDIRLVAVDCSVDDEKATHAPILAACAGLDLSILINNVGTAFAPFPIEEVEPEKITALINLNCIFLTKLTRALLPRLCDHVRAAAGAANVNVRNAKAGAVVVNISSFASLIPAPFYAVYAASKAYVSAFSRAIAAECESRSPDFGGGDEASAHAYRQVRVMNVTPAYVASKLSGVKHASLTVPSAEQYARAVW